ncbi:MAG: hypothetical protein WDZ82_00975 [Candidatus Paceibacterota bacterium]
MNEHPTFSLVWVVVTVLVAIGLGVLVLAMIVFSGDDQMSPVDDVVDEGVDTSDWQTYTSDEYDFSISHPSDWTVASHAPTDDNISETGMISPAINIFPEDADVSAPFDHHNEVANVSVFPSGVPTEGVAGEQEQSGMLFNTQPAEAFDYVLDDGTSWATLVRFEDVPESWEPYGFIWARADIADLEVECISDGEVVSSEQCDPLTGDRVIRSGSVDNDQREIQEEIIKSFEFHRE